MQIGSPGGAYGPSAVMSRPTVGRAISALPRRAAPPGALQSALAIARRMPAPNMGKMLPGLGTGSRTRANVLQNELARRLALSRHMQAQAGTVDSPESGGYPNAVPGAQALPEPLTGPYIGTMDQGQDPGFQQATTVDPSVLLARARLSQMMGGS